MDAFNLAQLTKEMVVSQLRHLADPAVVAASVARGTLLARLRGSRLTPYQQREAVAEVLRGAAAGIVLMECPVPRCAAALLLMADPLARELGLDPEAVSAAAVQGLSDLRRFLAPEALALVGARLEATRPGAGLAFHRHCAGVRSDTSHPAYVPPA